MGVTSFPDLSAVQRAFQMAEHLPTRDSKRVRVGILAADGVLLLARTLHGRAQKEFLHDLLEPLGFVESWPPGGRRLYDCEVMFRFDATARGEAPDLVKDGGGGWPPAARWARAWV